MRIFAVSILVLIFFYGLYLTFIVGFLIPIFIETCALIMNKKYFKFLK